MSEIPSTAPPAPVPVSVTVTGPPSPVPVVNGYTQLMLTIAVLLLAVVTGLMGLQYLRSLRSVDDALVFGPNGGRFDDEPLGAAVREELDRIVDAGRFIPVTSVFLTRRRGTFGKNGDQFVWSSGDVERWERAGYVVARNRTPLEKVTHVSAADRHRLAAAGVDAEVTIEPTPKGRELACVDARSRTFGWPCLEAGLGEVDQLQIVRTEWGKKDLHHYRLILATFEIEPSAAMRALFTDRTFWGYRCAVVLRHDPYRDSWRVVAFNADPFGDRDLDTTEIVKLWSSMER